MLPANLRVSDKRSSEVKMFGRLVTALMEIISLSQQQLYDISITTEVIEVIEREEY